MLGFILFKKAFSWTKDDLKDLPLVDESGEKVRVREKRLEDIENEFSWRTDQELSRLDATRPISMSYDDFYRYSREEMRFASYRSKRLALETLDGVHIGNVMYYDLNPQKKETEIGIMIGHKDYWGKGYGSDALQVIVRYLFHTLELNRVYLHTLSWNYRAQSAFAKVGFKEVRPVRRGGQDFVLMDLIKENFN